jgi:hypothetical protein
MAVLNSLMARQRQGAGRPIGFIRTTLQMNVHASTEFSDEDPRHSPAVRKHLADKHIGIVRQLLRNKTPPSDLSDRDIAAIQSAVQHTTDPNSASIVQTVLAAANAAMPVAAQKEMDAFLKHHGFSKEEYYRAIARVGTGMSPEQVMVTYREILAREGESQALRSGNMTGSEFTGNPSSISMSNYTSEGRQFYATGMTYGTFDHLRQHTLPDGSKFSGTNILHAGQDAVTQKISPNNKPFVTALATLDKYHPQGRDFRNKKGPELQNAVAEDNEMARLSEAYKGAKTEEDRARIKAQLDARILQIKSDTGVTAHIATLPPQAKDAGNVWADTHIDKGLDKLLPNNPEARMRLGKTAKDAQRALHTPQVQAARRIYEAELRKTAGTDPSKLAEVEALIARQTRERAEKDKAEEDAITAKKEVAAAKRDVADARKDVADAKKDVADAYAAFGAPSVTEPVKEPGKDTDSIPVAKVDTQQGQKVAKKDNAPATSTVAKVEPKKQAPGSKTVAPA